MKLLAASDDIDATIADIRLRTPLRALAAADGYELRELSFVACTQVDMDWADVLIAQRPSTARAVALLRRMRRRGGRVVVDMDDLLTAMAPHLAQATQATVRAEWCRRCLGLADVAAVSTVRLGQAISPHVARWVEIPNYAWPHTLAAGGAERSTGADAPSSLLLAASDRISMDFLYGPLRRLLQARGNGVRIIAVGPPGEQLLSAGVPVQRLPLAPRADFLALVHGLPNAVALIPLDDSPFSACKSAIKFFDLAVVGVPVVCSKLPPYSDVVDAGRTGWLVENTESAWEAALREVLDNAEERRLRRAAAAADVAERFSLSRTVEAWGGLLGSLPPRTAPPPGGQLRGFMDSLSAALLQANRERVARRRRRAQGR